MTLQPKLRFSGLTPLLVLASSCSLVYDLSPDQCGKTADCEHFGANFICEEGICKDRSPATGGSAGDTGSGGSGNDTGSGGDGATSGAAGSGNRGGTGGKAGSGGKGGSGNDTGSGGSGNDTGSGGNGNDTGTGGSSGEGGMPPMSECDTHDECFELKNDGLPYACVTGQCVNLLTDECPYVLPLYDTTYQNLRSDDDAIVIGAFARLDVGGGNAVIENFDLALEQIAVEVGGIPAGGDHRQIVTVLCGSYYDTQTELIDVVDHLVEDLKVPAILATLDTRDQQYVFEQRTRAADVFMMVPIESDDNMVDLQDDGLVYHMLSGPHDLAVTYQPLIDRTIGHLQSVGVLGPSAPYEEARIALIRATDDRFLDDLGIDFRDTVRWNGRSAEENEAAVPVAFKSVGSFSEPPTFDQSDYVDAILEIRPHIVVGATDSEMTASASDGSYKSIIELIEERWAGVAGTQPRPFYILSPFAYGGPRTTLLTKYPDVRTRLLGIGWPATPELQAYQDYVEAYQEKHPSGTNYNLENFFDAAYFLVYGMAAAGPQIRGETIAEGMIRITTGTTEYNVGRADLNNAFNFLSSSLSAKVDLIGANGKPDWNAGGARHNPASVWCIQDQNNQWRYLGDVLTYNDQTLLLEGSVPSTCFVFQDPPP
jgi:hypothetical protein